MREGNLSKNKLRPSASLPSPLPSPRPQLQSFTQSRARPAGDQLKAKSTTRYRGHKKRTWEGSGLFICGVATRVKEQQSRGETMMFCEALNREVLKHISKSVELSLLPPFCRASAPVKVHSIWYIRDIVIFCLGIVPYFFQNFA